MTYRRYNDGEELRLEHRGMELFGLRGVTGLPDIFPV